MQRFEMIEAMWGLHLTGVVRTFDAAVTTGPQRKRAIHEMLADLQRAKPSIAMLPRSANA